MNNTFAWRSTHLLEWCLLIAWAGAALLLDLLWVDLYDKLWFTAHLLPTALWLALAALACYFLVRAVDRDRAAPMLLLAALAGAGVLQASAGNRLSLVGRFYLLKPHYEAILTDLQQGRVPPTPADRFIVDAGPPLRVAFPWPGGLIDNWSGVVYDPTGLVRKASLFKPDLSNLGDADLRPVRSLFGGDLYRCEHLGGHWYFCSFT